MSSYKDITGDLFSLQSTHVIAQGVNCEAAMASGIAAQFGRRFPAMRKFYNAVCNAGQLAPGGMLPWHGQDTTNGAWTHVANCASQKRPGADARYSWLNDSLDLATAYARAHELPLAIPLIGCGIGGLMEHEARGVFETLGSWIDLTVVTYG